MTLRELAATAAPPSLRLAIVRRGSVVAWALAVGLLVEAVTCILRFEMGVTADDFKRDAHVLVQLHHMFWSVPLLLALPFVWRRPRVRRCLLGASLGLIASDLAHHFVVLPLTTGGFGWHWP